MDFSLWFTTGLQHIADWQGYDHILFLFALCAGYSIYDWKKVLILITAFTIGHTATLILSTFNVFTFKSALVEFFIALSILISCVYNFISLNHQKKNNYNPMYFLSFGFGLIHGLGFSYYLKSLLGSEESIFMPLLSFNLGLEAGQILIVLIELLMAYILTKLLGVSNANKSFFISSAIFGVAVLLCIQRLNELIYQ